MTHKQVLVLIAAFLVPCPCAGGDAAASPVPLAQAHAHNDYVHEHPLHDALAHGFCSVEADIFLVDGNLLVGHGRSELSPERTLQTLYLDPLRQRVKNNGASVYPGGHLFSLLIDIKTDGQATYRALAKVLAGYADILSSVVDGKVTSRAVTVVVSGERPWQLIEAESTRYAGVDGRLSNLESNRPAHLMPWISDNWLLHFRWRGQGPIGSDDRKKLQEIVAKAHAAGRRVRFWATPASPVLWGELLDAGVDLINADDLAGLEAFLLGRGKAAITGSLAYIGLQVLPELVIDGRNARIHTQGLVVTDRHYYVTGRLEGRPTKALLLRFERTDPSKVEHVDITAGSSDEKTDCLDHPGGFDSDGKFLWIPVSESRPLSQSVILRFPQCSDKPLRELKAETAFRVDDHIGAIAYDPATAQLFGANWDTRLIYVWKSDGTLVAKLSQAEILPPDRSRAFAVQDWKASQRGRIVAGAIDKSRQRPQDESRAVLWLLDVQSKREAGLVRLPSPPDRDLALAREGMAVLGDEVFFLPADLGDHAVVYRYQWTSQQ